MKIKSILLLCFVVFLTQNANSQACCSSGTPLSAQMGLAFLNEKDVVFSLAYDYNNLQTMFSEAKDLGSDERKRISQNILFRFQYALSDRWALGFSIPYVFRSENNIESQASYSSLSASGVGDMLLQVNYAIKRYGNSNFLISSGIKFPSGSNEEENEFGFVLPSDLQPGTGSWDFIFSGYSEVNNIWDGNFNFNTSISARINGEGERYNGLQNYQFGNAFQLITGLNYEILLKKFYFVPSLNISYRRTLIDLTEGELTPNTGGDWLNLIPGLSFYYNDVILLFSSTIPIFRYLEGSQLTTSYQFYFQLEYTIKSKKNEIQIL